MTLEDLYDRYGVKMYHFLALKLGSSEDAEDVIQETFCRLARYSVRWAIVRNPGAFVFKIARNEANRFLARRIRRRKAERKDDPIPPISDPTAQLDDQTHQRNDSAALLARELSVLPDEQKEVIILKIFQDFTFKEIAAICGISTNTAASRYRYGIGKLRSRLEEN
jgi:RNA polymerase sigma-70 factor (ECF subfamily)